MELKRIAVSIRSEQLEEVENRLKDRMFWASPWITSKTTASQQRRQLRSPSVLNPFTHSSR